MRFDVKAPCTLNGFKVNTEYPGERLFMLYSEDAELIDSLRMNLDIGWQYVPVNFHLYPADGRYRLTTDSDQNISLTGARSPLLASTFNDVDYPYETQHDLIRIIESQDGKGVYDYFFE